MACTAVTEFSWLSELQLLLRIEKIYKSFVVIIVKKNLQISLFGSLQISAFLCSIVKPKYLNEM